MMRRLFAGLSVIGLYLMVSSASAQPLDSLRTAACYGWHYHDSLDSELRVIQSRESSVISTNGCSVRVTVTLDSLGQVIWAEINMPRGNDHSRARGMAIHQAFCWRFTPPVHHGHPISGLRLTKYFFFSGRDCRTQEREF